MLNVDSRANVDLGNNHFDYEVKMITSHHQGLILKSLLDHHLVSDFEYPRARVWSLYYDTLNFDFLNEKINSDYHKSKVRIRTYFPLEDPSLVNFENGYQHQNLHQNPYFLEIKEKFDNKRTKKRFKRAINHQIFNDFNHDTLMDIGEELRRELSDHYQTLFPMFVVSYDRYRYIHQPTQLRLCLDLNIFCPQVNQRFLTLGNLSYLKECVFELKGQIKEIPQDLRFLEKFHLKLNSFSKYLAVHEQLIKKY